MAGVAICWATLASVGLVACGDGEDTGGAPSSATQVPASSGGGGPGPSAPQDTNSPGTGAPGTGDPGTGDPGAATPAVEATTVVALDEPIDLVPRPGDDHLWVAERAGKVRRLAVSDQGGTLRHEGEAVLDITDQTTTDSERGLLGIAFSESGDTLFVSYTDPQGDTRLVSYAIEGETVDVASRTVLMAVDQPYSNHNGGHVVLGPDGKLWFGLGDGGSGDDPQNRAQDPEIPLGKMVRLDPEGGEPEIVISGIRNPWRFSFDTDGSLWIGDVGQNQWEEINRLPADQTVGANLGWSALEGTHENPNVDAEGRTGADPVPPVFEYSHDGGNCSVTGGFVYRGEEIPSLQGAYLFADYCAGRLRALRLDDDGKLAAEYDLGIDVAAPVSFGADVDGEPYVLSGEGTIVRLVDAG